MALYSVWDWDRNSWRVYSTKTPVSVGDDPVPHNGQVTKLGADPDTNVKALPRNAKFLRYDTVPRGEVRRERRSLLDVGDDAGSGNQNTSTWWWLAGGVAVGWALSSWARRRRAS